MVYRVKDLSMHGEVIFDGLARPGYVKHLTLGRIEPCPMPFPTAGVY